MWDYLFDPNPNISIIPDFSIKFGSGMKNKLAEKSPRELTKLFKSRLISILYEILAQGNNVKDNSLGIKNIPDGKPILYILRSKNSCTLKREINSMRDGITLDKYRV